MLGVENLDKMKGGDMATEYVCGTCLVKMREEMANGN